MMQMVVPSASRALGIASMACLKVTLLRLPQSSSEPSKHAAWEEQGDYHTRKAALPNEMEM